MPEWFTTSNESHVSRVHVQSIAKTVRVYPIRETARTSESIQLMNPTSISMGVVQDRLYSACIILLPTWSLSMSPSHPSIRFRSLRLVLWVKRLPTFSFGGVKRRVMSRQVPIRLLCAPMECSKTRNIVPLFLLVRLTIRSDALQVNVFLWTRLVAMLCL